MVKRNHSLLIAAVAAALFFTAALTPSAAGTGQAPQVRGADLFWQGPDFDVAQAQGLTPTAEGLRLAAGAGSGTYESTPLSAPLPFTAVVPSWRASVPEGAAFSLMLRTAGADGIWTPWLTVMENDDWVLPEDDDMVGTMVVAPAPYETHEKVQFAVTLLASLADEAPVLEELRLTFIDAGAGLPAGEPQAPASPEPGYPKPPVVPRTTWCTDSDCVYYNDISYYPVTHLLVHHTVTSNAATNWEAIVRAIWYFHTYTRGWGDIGYNYLVDPTGVIYEGHRGGDDVVGTHAAGANRGSMGTSLMGTFTAANENPPGIAPPPAMVNALVEILAWKADQKDIDVFSSSDYLPDLPWGIPNLGGHRDVYGTTTCPGVQAHDILPQVQQRVADKIGFQSPHIYADEESGAFTASNNGHWYAGPYQCGFNQHSLYTFSVTDAQYSTNWGRWQPDFPHDGRYEIEILAPFCNTGEPDTHGAIYQIHHTGGVANVVADQGDNLGEWVSLGSFTLNDSSYVYLTDISATESNAAVWFDAVRFRFLNATATNTSPLNDTWFKQRNVQFNWTVSNQASLSGLTFQVATDSQMNNVIVSQALSTSTTSWTHTFSQDYARLYWRVVLHNSDGNLGYSTPTYFGVDTVAPTTTVSGIIRQANGHYVVQLSGSDAMSGIAAYGLQYRLDGSSTWLTLPVNPGAAAVLFVAPQPGQVYWFRSQATDRAGNVAPFSGNGQNYTGAAVLYPHNSLQPAVGGGL